MKTGFHEGRPPHPRYGAPLGGAPKTWGGLTFRPYRDGIASTCRCSDDFRIAVLTVQGPRRWSYIAAVDGVALLNRTGHVKRFRSEATAAEAGVEALKQTMWRGGA